MNKFIIPILLFPILSYAGAINGGGGKGVLCINGPQRTIVALDLYEGENVWGYKIQRASTIDGALEAVAPKFYEALMRQPLQNWPHDPKNVAAIVKEWAGYYQEFIKQLQFIPAGTRLTVTSDSTIYLQPAQSCQIVQVIEYVDSGYGQGAILTDREYWDLLSPSDKLAIYYHEYMYKALRDQKLAATSDKVRHLMGLVFASDPYPYPYAALDGLTGIVECKSSDFWVHFFVIPTPQTPYWGQYRSILIFSAAWPYTNLMPVEYRALSFAEPNKFMQMSGDGYAGGAQSIQLSSTIDFMELELVGKPYCSPGSNFNCPIYFSVKGPGPDGKPLETQVSCNWASPHPQ